MGSGFIDFGKSSQGDNISFTRTATHVVMNSNGKKSLKITHDAWKRLVDAMSNDGGLPTQIMAGEIIGYRVWRYSEGYLRSVFRDDLWSPDEPMSGYVGEDYQKSGVYAYKSKSSAMTHLRSMSSPAFLGTVKLWGDVVEHENGYRAQYVRVLTIDLARDVPSSKLLAELRLRYNVRGAGSECLITTKVPFAADVVVRCLCCINVGVLFFLVCRYVIHQFSGQ